MLFIFFALLFYFWFILKQIEFESSFVIVIILILFIIASFATLTVTIDEKYLKIKFGYGIFKKRFALQDIVRTSSVKNHWYYGWGIRIWFWPYMLIYNVSGFDAVEIKMKNNKIYRIGTDEPKKLKQAILEAIKR